MTIVHLIGETGQAAFICLPMLPAHLDGEVIIQGCITRSLEAESLLVSTLRGYTRRSFSIEQSGLAHVAVDKHSHFARSTELIKAVH